MNNSKEQTLAMVLKDAFPSQRPLTGRETPPLASRSLPPVRSPANVPQAAQMIPGIVYTSKAAQLNFVHLTEDNMDVQNKQRRFSVCLTIPKTDSCVNEINSAINVAVQSGRERFGPNFAPTLGGLRDGDKERQRYLEFSGRYFLNASSSKRPQLVDETGKQLTTQYEVSVGSVGVACIKFSPWCNRNNGTMGIACKILAFKKYGAVQTEHVDYFANYF